VVGALRRHGGILLIRAGGRLETVAARDGVVEESDRLQDELDEGPCRDSSWHRETLLSSDVAANARWPPWAPGHRQRAGGRANQRRGSADRRDQRLLDTVGSNPV